MPTAQETAEYEAEREGALAYRRDPKGDPRAPYDGRTRLGKAWYAGWKAAKENDPPNGSKEGGDA